MILFEDSTMFVTVVIIIGIIVGIVSEPAISSAIYETNLDLHLLNFEGKPNIGLPDEEGGWPYGWYCYPKTEHNFRVNEYMKWAVNEKGICEWR